jgi:hypothetical protein
MSRQAVLDGEAPLMQGAEAASEARSIGRVFEADAESTRKIGPVVLPGRPSRATTESRLP